MNVQGTETRPVDAIVVGAGFAGLYMLHRLRGSGFRALVFEMGADVGGTWFWNRYPGARCDVESIDYSYYFDEDLQQEWDWTERFATQPEILRYLKHVAERFDLRSMIEFNTTVSGAQWLETERRWRVQTLAGESIDARFLILATGSLSAAKAPDIAGLDSFAGLVLHTADWPQNGADLTGQRVGVIGTGSSAIQAIPLIAAQAKHLTVFQRTPAFTIPARNAPLEPNHVTAFKARYRDHRADCLRTVTGVLYHSTGQKALSVSEKERRAAYMDAWARGGAGFTNTFIDITRDRSANETAAAFIHERIREIVKDSHTAELLTPRDYPVGTKRVAVDTDYFETFNQPNVKLKSLRETPLLGVVPEGVETTDGVTALDVLVLATGFDALTGSFMRIDARNSQGASLAQAWSAGPRTYLGLMTSGFPNLFFIAGPGSPSVLSNMVLSIEQHAEWISECLTAMRDAGRTRIEAQPEAENEWGAQVQAAAAKTLFPSGNSWYLGANVPGKPRVFMPFLGGVARYRETCDTVVADGYRGFTMT
jgi:cyclohexanone monooxygenase